MTTFLTLFTLFFGVWIYIILTHGYLDYLFNSSKSKINNARSAGSISGAEGKISRRALWILLRCFLTTVMSITKKETRFAIYLHLCHAEISLLQAIII